MENTGGPAFPQLMVAHPNGSMTCGWDGYGMGGMTLRDYFAAHAPIDIPEWFKHVEPTKDGYPAMPNHEELDPSHQKIALDWQRDPCFDLPEEIAWYGKKVEAHRDGQAAWRRLNDLRRFIQWRYAYADLMVEARDK